jgi:DHHC palmitoyltransferase
MLLLQWLFHIYNASIHSKHYTSLLGLNTCVGKKNYHHFLHTMFYIGAMLIIHSFIQVALIVDIFLGGVSKDRANEWFNTNSYAVIAGIYIGFVVFDAVALSLILQLLHFHSVLRKEGLTTYKYVVRETQRRREKLNQEEARKTQRQLAMGKANDEGKVWLAARLPYGEKCPCCDPLPPPEEEKKEEETNGQQRQPAPTYAPIDHQESLDSCEEDTADTATNVQGQVNGNGTTDHPPDVENGETNGSHEVTFVAVAAA